jgi:hypothetical protein
MKRIIYFLIFSLIIGGCATTQELVGKTEELGYAYTIDYPYKEVFSAAIKAVYRQPRQRVLEENFEEGYIYINPTGAMGASKTVILLKPASKNKTRLKIRTYLNPSSCEDFHSKLVRDMKMILKYKTGD